MSEVKKGVYTLTELEEASKEPDVWHLGYTGDKYYLCGEPVVWLDEDSSGWDSPDGPVCPECRRIADLIKRAGG